MAASKIDERAILPKIVGNRRGMFLDDKGFIRSSLEKKMREKI